MQLKDFLMTKLYNKILRNQQKVKKQVKYFESKIG